MTRHLSDPQFDDPRAHAAWLMARAHGLFDFFWPASIDPAGGFHTLDVAGRPRSDPARGLHGTARMVHCAAIGHLLGRPLADDVLDHGMRYLWDAHRDATHGGYVWTMGADRPLDDGPLDATKQAYGHAFVLLAASSAHVVGHPHAARLLADVTAVLERRFWDADIGASREAFAADWSPFGDYRGQNANMHLTEALMAAFEATGDATYLERARSIATLIVDRHARANGWRVPEHYDADWRVDRDYDGDAMFRPRGVTPGHALEWARLLIQLWQLGGQRDAWMPDAAANLFATACRTAWDTDRGGFNYTLGWDDRPDRADRFWWPCCEAIGAAGVLRQINDDPTFEAWYRRIWTFADTHLIDRDRGGWHAELNAGLKPVPNVFDGKPDLYHALQACLIPAYPSDGSITRQLLRARDDG